jgi:hypothetical protein
MTLSSGCPRESAVLATHRVNLLHATTLRSQKRLAHDGRAICPDAPTGSLIRELELVPGGRAGPLGGTPQLREVAVRSWCSSASWKRSSTASPVSLRGPLSQHGELCVGHAPQWALRPRDGSVVLGFVLRASDRGRTGPLSPFCRPGSRGRGEAAGPPTAHDGGSASLPARGGPRMVWVVVSIGGLLVETSFIVVLARQTTGRFEDTADPRGERPVDRRRND